LPSSLPSSSSSSSTSSFYFFLPVVSFSASSSVSRFLLPLDTLGNSNFAAFIPTIVA